MLSRTTECSARRKRGRPSTVSGGRHAVPSGLGGSVPVFVKFERACARDTLREMMKLEYIYEGDRDVFVDYSWERALSIDNEIYPEWVLELISTLYFDKDADRTILMKEKCLFTEEEVEHCLFEVYFSKLEVDDKQFDYKDYWTRVGHYVTKIASFLGYCVDDEIKKCSEPIDYEY
ncbi:hypothetical protein Tco_1480611 [Tanacetum coccineum]